MTAFANLFGIGGSSVIARALGTTNYKRAQTSFYISFVGALLCAIFYSIITLIFSKSFLIYIGGDPSNIDYAIGYTMIVIVIGSIPTILSATFAHLIRSTGQSKTASFGITLGAILNMILDPIFMFVILPEGYEVIGAAG